MSIDFISRDCPLCGSNKSRHILTDINRREGMQISSSLGECMNCRMQYVNPVPNEESLFRLYNEGIIDPVAEKSTVIQSVSKLRTQVKPLRKFFHTINGLLRGHPHDWPDENGNGRSILDFGCHDGTKLTYWYQRGWQVSGIDLNYQAIEMAKQRFPEGWFWCGDLPKLEIKERFDFIRCDNVFEHLTDPMVYLTELRNLLKPTGKLLIFVPNGAALSFKLFRHYSSVIWMPLHLNLFTTQTMKRFLEAGELENVFCKTFSPVGSWEWTQRQILLKPGFNRREGRKIEILLKILSILNYPGETLAQWFGFGEELIAIGKKIEK